MVVACPSRLVVPTSRSVPRWSDPDVRMMCGRQPDEPALRHPGTRDLLRSRDRHGEHRPAAVEQGDRRVTGHGVTGTGARSTGLLLSNTTRTWLPRRKAATPTLQPSGSSNPPSLPFDAGTIAAAMDTGPLSARPDGCSGTVRRRGAGAGCVAEGDGTGPLLPVIVLPAWLAGGRPPQPWAREGRVARYRWKPTDRRRPQGCRPAPCG